MKTNVSAQSESPVGLFYPMDEAPKMAQIITVDVCGQWSDPTNISCPSSGGSVPKIIWGHHWYNIIIIPIKILGSDKIIMEVGGDKVKSGGDDGVVMYLQH